MRGGRSKIRVALVRGVVLGVALAASGTALGTVFAPADATQAAGTCAHIAQGFRPTSLTIDGLLKSTKVLSMGQDRGGVPRPPPLTDRGKWQFAWDKAAGTRPGGAEGVVRLTAHTYPSDGSHGPALGNLLLDRLRTGASLEVSGARGERMCYRVTERVEVSATASLSGYYDTIGPPRLAILVCSGKRRGPGDWSRRTIWYADPTSTPSEPSPGRGGRSASTRFSP